MFYHKYRCCEMNDSQASFEPPTHSPYQRVYQRGWLEIIEALVDGTFVCKVTVMPQRPQYIWVIIARWAIELSCFWAHLVNFLNGSTVDHPANTTA